MNYLIYDLEIIKCIPTKGAKFDGYEYCAGWDDHANMGISVVGWAMPEDSGAFKFEDGPEVLASLAEGRIIVGFNSKNFDDKLCAANGVNICSHYDLLEEIRIAAYGSPRWQDCPQGFSYSLGVIGAANGFPKSGSGELAPQLWQQGKEHEVLVYCHNDVKITRSLLELGLSGNLKDPNTGDVLCLRPLPTL